MTRVILITLGLLLVGVAFMSGAQVADTREGLIAEVVSLFAGLGGVILLLFGLVPRRRYQRPNALRAERSSQVAVRRNANDLVLGGAGIAIAAALFAGLALSGGWLWAGLGGLLLVPMVAGSVYLLVAFSRAKERDWTVDLPRLFSLRARD